MFRKILLLLVASVLLGCSAPVSETVTPVAEKPPKEQIREILTNVAANGQTGSELGTMMQQITKLKETDASTAAALEPDGNALMSISDPAAAKKKAAEMLKKLGG